jgi:hypothetical protein
MKQIPGLKTVKATPMEKTRLMADENTIDGYDERLITFPRGIPPAFLVNADESDFADSTDARPKTVVIPADCSLDYIQIPMDPHIKRSALVLVIVADGTGLVPLRIILHFIIERELYSWGYEVTKVIFKYHEHEFIAVQLFEEWVNSVFMPYYADQRELTNNIGWGS